MCRAFTPREKPAATIAVQHGDEALTWAQLEAGANRRAHAFRDRGVKPGDFVAIGLPNGNSFFEDEFRRLEMRRDADLAVAQTAAWRGRADPRNPQTLAGRRWRAGLGRAERAAERFFAARLSRHARFMRLSLVTGRR